MKRYALLFLLLLAWTAGACADEFARQSLKNLEGVRLLIEVGKDSGLQETTLQTGAEQRLTAAGIPLLDHDTWLATPGGQYLYVHIDVLCPNAGDICAYAIRVELRQDALLARAPTLKVHGATTWRSTRVGVAPTAEVSDRIRQSAIGLVDDFAADYRAANPDPAP